MHKQVAVKMFGSGAALARAIGVTRQYVSAMPDELPISISDRVVGAALRTGKIPAREVSMAFPDYNPKRAKQ